MTYAAAIATGAVAGTRSMCSTTAPFSVIVPVHNEATRLDETVPRLLEGLPPGCEVIYVCNGCTDGSERLLRALVGKSAQIITAPRGKAKAIRSGEERAHLMPRFYVDADVTIGGADLAKLALRLVEPIELVSPRIVFDMRGVGPAMRRVYRLSLSLPHARHAAFHHVLGVSAAARSRWGRFPDLLADDAFIESRIPLKHKRVMSDVTVTVRPPRTLWSWIRVRARWHAGHRQMRRAGYAPPHTHGQFRTVGHRLRESGSRLDALLYVGSVLVARILSAWLRQGWYSDRTSR